MSGLQIAMIAVAAASLIAGAALRLGRITGTVALALLAGAVLAAGACGPALAGEGGRRAAAYPTGSKRK